jgi:hypothetical protein
VKPAVAGHDARQAAFVGGFGEFVDELGGGGVAHPAAVFAGGHAQPDEQVALAGAGRDSDRLQHLRRVLPGEVRVTSAVHPLFGRVLRATGFKRWEGALLLVVVLPDGSPGTVPAAATDVLGTAPAEAMVSTLSVEGVRRLRRLLAAFGGGGGSRSRARTRK